MKKFLILALLLLGAACDTSEERADKHFETAAEYVESGDTDRAMIELRNALQLNGTHHDALLMMAEIQQDRGNVQGAFRSYRRLVEAFPEDPDANRELAQIAFDANEFDQARTFAETSERLTPGTPAIAAVMTGLDYREASLDKDEEAMATVAAKAQAQLEADASLSIARRVVIAEALRQQQFGAALEAIEGGIEQDDTNRELYNLRLGVLNQLGDKSAVEEQLQRMVTQFPEDEAIGAMLVRWYISEKRIDEAEAWLRDRVTPTEADTEPRLTLVRFLTELRGPQAALAELDTILAEDPVPADIAADRNTFTALHAGLLFTTGAANDAIAELQELIGSIDGATAEGEELQKLNRYKVSLAQMQEATGNQVAARSLVEEVLAADTSNVEALKLKARWQVLDDQTAEAIVNLRSALSEAPRDAAIMTLLASAYEREGNRELMAEMLSLAVETSNRAPQQSLQYASFLAQDQKFRAAEEVLINALRLAPSNVQLLSALGRVHLAMEDWARARQDLERLRQLDAPQAEAMANELEAQLLARQSKTDELTSFLEQQGEGDVSSAAAVIRANLLSGRTDEALARSEELLAEFPDDGAAKFIRGLVLAITGSYGEAIPLLEETVDARPQAEQAWTALYSAYLRSDQPDQAVATLDRAIAARPESMNLQWVKAGVLEREGDIDGAIAIYEDLYARNSTAVVIANNLASLLSSHRDDPESLDRAYTIARRLKGTGVPAFQDTYGWIAFLRGNTEEALEPMEAAAAGIPNDPTVQYHLAEVYAALGRTEEARTAYEKGRQLIESAEAAPPGLVSKISAGLDTLEAAPQGD